MCSPKNVTSTTFVSMLQSERETLKSILRTFDINKPNGKIAGYMVRYLTDYCNRRITKIDEWEKFMELNLTITFIPFNKDNG